MIDIKNEILKRIEFNGGLKNWHNHCDRALTINNENFSKAKLPLKQKWELVRELKQNSSIDGLVYRMSKVIEDQINQGVKVYCTFLDFDEYSKDKPFIAFNKIKELYGKDIELICANQTLEPIVNNEEWFNIGAKNVDIIGSLPLRDGKNIKKHLDIVLNKAKELNKKIHIHSDQFNSPEEKETELILDKIEEHGMQGKVSLIHCISLNCHEKEYRHKIYKRLEETKTNIIVCVTAWIDSPRSEVLMPFHNSCCPVDELIDYNIKIGIGVDNQNDLMCPLSSGNMYGEIELLAKVLRLYNKATLVKIATTDLK